MAKIAYVEIRPRRTGDEVAERAYDAGVTTMMCEVLRRLQHLRTGDWDELYRTAFGGCHVLRPLRRRPSASVMEGIALAVALIVDQWTPA